MRTIWNLSAFSIAFLALIACNTAHIRGDRSAEKFDTLNVDLVGYMPSCIFSPALYVKKANGWTRVNTRLPLKGMYFLDGVFESGGCDFVQCVPIPKPLKIPLVEFIENGKRETPVRGAVDPQTWMARAFYSSALHGDIRLEFTYYKDSTCADTVKFTKEFHR